MTTARDIRTKIGSIKNTQKITKAMQMVSAGKMRKAQDRMAASRPYAEKILNVISHLAQSHPEYRHPYLVAREIKRVGYLVITTDRGLCGALNLNLLKESMQHMKRWSEKGVEHDLCLVGNKADSFFRIFGGHVIAKVSQISESTGLQDLIGAVRVLLDAYNDGQVDQLYICFNRFINTMKQKAVIQPLLPIVSLTETKDLYWDYIYEPDSRELLEGLLIRYIESQVYQGILENNASEQAARMVAMKTASDNAEHLVDGLKLAFNKMRQAAITNEIAEIVGGAAGTRR